MLPAKPAPPEPTPGNQATFYSVYVAKLAECVTAHPEEYGYPISEVGTVARRMIAALARGHASIAGPVIAKTCRQLGIKPRVKDIKEYLTA